jgi:hypothetical protein
VDAGCARRIEPIESGEAHAPELALTLAFWPAEHVDTNVSAVRTHQRFPYVKMLGSETAQ